MRNIRVVLMTSLLFAACGGDDPAPSCVQALGHYYSAGCSYFDGTANPPTMIAQSQMVTFCQTAAAEAPRSCQGELDAWLVCNNEVPMPASTNSDCDCSQEYMALLRCE